MPDPAAGRQHRVGAQGPLCRRLALRRPRRQSGAVHRNTTTQDPRWTSGALRTGLALGLLWAAMAAQAGERLDCGDRRSLTLSGGQASAIRVAGGHVNLREQGEDLEWSTDAIQWHAVPLRPPGLGETWLELGAGQSLHLRLLPGRHSGSAELALACGAQPAMARCVLALQAGAAPPALAELPRPERLRCDALLAHDQAHRSSGAGKAESSRAEYLRAATLWRELGDPARAAAARLAVAEQSTHAGRARRALHEAIAAEIANRRSGNHYYAARSLQTAAVAAQRLGLARPAKRMTAVLGRRYAALGAWSDWATIQYNQAMRGLLAGDEAAATAALAAIDAVDAAQLKPLARGRTAHLRMTLALRAGRIRDAVQAAREAEGHFARAGEKGQIIASLRVLADLHRQLGLEREALQLLERALLLAPVQEAPQRTAAILKVYGALAVDRGQYRLARWFLRAAEALYGSLGLDIELRWAAAQRHAVEWRLGERSPDSARTLDAAPDLPPACAPRAEALIRAGRAQAALDKLDRAECRPNNFELAIEQAAVRALALSRTAGRQAARAALLQLAERVDALLADAGAALQYASRRRLLRLRDAWIAADAGHRPSDLWRVAIATHPYRPARATPAPARADASLAIGRALLADASAAQHADAGEALLQVLARPAPTAGRASVDLAAVRAALPADALLLIWVVGETGGHSLWVGAREMATGELPARHELRTQLARLHASLADPAATEDQIRQHAANTSQALLAGAPPGPPPKRLLVLADEMLGSTPLALLPWPGTQQALIDTSAVEWITTFEQATTAAAPGAATRVRAFVADLGVPGHPQLASLPVARLEPRLIAAAQPAWQVTQVADAAPLRLIEALQEDGDIVHVAAHGLQDPARLGFSGILLGAAAGDAEPRFLSWLDLVEHRLRADLVVLNACQLGATPGNHGQANASFAAALANAGVDHVVAAAWPLSDAATRVWVPAFYRALDPARPGSSADALRAAQLALRDSPHFRHPWHWAALAHHRRLLLPASPSAHGPLLREITP